MPKSALIALVFAVASTTCSHVSPIPPMKGLPSGPIPVCGAEKADFEVVTINAGLAAGVISHAALRTEPFAEAVRAYRDSGIVCLQEVWKEEAVQAVVNDLGLPPDNVYRVDTRGEGEEPGRFTCKPNQLDDLLSCLHSKCEGASGEDTTICALRKCRWNLAKLKWFGMPCLNCLTASVGKNEQDIVRDCTGSRGVSRAYDGQNGVILASKWPLKNRLALSLPSSGVNRVALIASVDVPGAGTVEVACTHITSPEDDVPPTNPRFKSWTEEQAVQLEMIIATLKSRAGSNPAILVGDLNTGLRLEKDGRLKLEDVWTRLPAAGFDAPAARAEPFLCSMCPTNRLRGYTGSNRLIDHVLIHDPPGGAGLSAVCAGQVMNDRVTLIGPSGTAVETELSDHYGVRVKLKVVK